MFFVSQRVVLFVHFSLSFFFFFFFFAPFCFGGRGGQTDKRSPSRGPLFLFFETLETTPHGHTRDQSRINQSALKSTLPLTRKYFASPKHTHREREKKRRKERERQGAHVHARQ